ncbi:MAG TPA: RNA methyltransferase [Bacteroidales bacterium]|nr:RNA methyltransferase [Bacteroidales bacterium]
MLSSSQIKHIRSLQQGKFRKELGLFIAEGPKIVGELPGSFIRVEAVYGLKPWVEENASRFEFIKARVYEISQKELDRISGMTTPNQVLAVCHVPDRDTSEIYSEDGILLVLDGIRDPGNLGTIIRTADWFGINNILCSEDCVESFNPKVVQASMGSISRVKVFSARLEDFLQGLEQEIYATVMNGESVFDANPGQGVYLIGNEANGIRPEVLQYATKNISIPAGGGAESLNAAVAAGIILALATR